MKYKLIQRALCFARHKGIPNQYSGRFCFTNLLVQKLLLFRPIQRAVYSLEKLDKVLHCSVRRKHPLFLYLEPVSSKPPSFSTDFTLSAVTRHKGQSFAILCQAQAFPIPVFRQVL
uniref:SFRICE_009626 n=1 Tax=Spodoptera frugiperda TaxID=7108 RepID=A0A2H1WWH5_SPOFR